MALTADLTREEVRTKAMAMIGITIGITFAISLVLAPMLYQAIDVPGILRNRRIGASGHAVCGLCNSKSGHYALPFWFWGEQQAIWRCAA